MNIDSETELQNVFLSEMFTILKLHLKLQKANLHQVYALEMVRIAEWLFLHADSSLTDVGSY